MTDKKPNKRFNTYTNKEYMKIVVLAYTKEQTFEFSKYLSGSNKEPIRGVFSSTYAKTQCIIFPRFVSKLDHQATTAAVEAIIIYVEKKEELAHITSVLERYGQVPIRLIVSEIDLSESAKSIGARFVQKPENSMEIKDLVDRLDREEFVKIREVFEKYDKDGGGSIDTEELKEIAEGMGYNKNDENFKKSMYALDLNQDGTISLDEFILWWKVGRQNTKALPVIYDLYHGVNGYIRDNFDMKNYSEDINRIEEEGLKNVCNQKILFRSPGIFKLKTFIEVSVAVGAEKRQEMAVNFLSKFTKVTSSSKANWISIHIPLNQKGKKLEVSKAKLLLDEFKENSLKWGEEKMGPAFINFFKHLLVFETSSSENSIILAIRMKIDIESLVKTALQNVIYILGHLQKQNESTWINLKVHSNVDLYDAVNNDITLGDFLNVSELVIEGSTFKDQQKAFYSALQEKNRELYSLFQIFFQPKNLDVEIECKVNEFFSNEISDWTKMSLKPLGLFLDFLKSNLSKELLASAENIEVGINAYDIFSRFKIYTAGTFGEN